ncbi:substrate-binding periplasmic protein [Planctobacterium marinum]|uniref:substrate-binding periplasmic protein n=1 Tax=Planctobacterium marinum TaxID=1631968 RepID=UPI001E33D5BF|nr:transporter substrate-binding domain-containing protein [Planctobacterium marinum]MCC2607332.1 transporter substrate-binding domain-containing protein [Planctobacterium marinum]
MNPLKRLPTTLVCFLFLMIPCLAQESSPAPGKTIFLLADEWCPYNCHPDSELPGFMVEIAKEVFSPHGYRVIYEKTNWSRAVRNARIGKVHGIIGALKGDAPGFVFPENSLGMTENLFWVPNTSNFAYQSITDLQAIRVGVIQGYSYGEDLDKYIESNKLNEATLHSISGQDALERILQSLILGRVDVIVEERAVMLNHLLYHPNKNEIKPAGRVSIDPVYIAFSPNRPESKQLAKLLDVGVAQLKAQGKLRIILEKYGLTEW